MNKMEQLDFDCNEMARMIEALKAMIEWLEGDGKDTAAWDELSTAKSALKKLKRVKVRIKMKSR